MDKSAKTLMVRPPRPRNICLLEGCDNPIVGNERLCAIHYYRLPRVTRRALAIEDRQATVRDHRLIAFVLGGQPLDQIFIV